jgi:broad specificity phosphatase PhoE
MPSRLILLIRHAQSEHHVRRLSGGWTDTPLTPLGHEQSRRLATRLRAELPDTVIRLYSSDLIRAQETARCIAEQFEVEPIIDARLREHNNGVAAGLTIDEVRVRFPNALRASIDERPYPEAETAREFYARQGISRNAVGTRRRTDPRLARRHDQQPGSVLAQASD